MDFFLSPTTIPGNGDIIDIYDAVDEIAHIHKIAEIITVVVKDENDAFLKELQGTDENADDKDKADDDNYRKPLMRILPITRRPTMRKAMTPPLTPIMTSRPTTTMR